MCLLGSSSSAPAACPPGFYCASGAVIGCLAGTYNPSEGASSIAACTACGVGTYGVSENASSVAACLPCGAGTVTGVPGQTQCDACGAGTYASGPAAAVCEPCPENTFAAGDGAGFCGACAAGSGSAPRASACWPGLLSVTARDDAPVVPGFSDGDLIVFTFSEPTDAAPVDPTNVSAAFELGGDVSGCIGDAAWGPDGTVLTLTVALSGAGCLATPASTLIGAVRAGVRGGWLRDASGCSAPAPPSRALLPLSGSWGALTVPAFMPNAALRPGAWAFDDGHNVGLGPGDVLELRFDSPPREVPVDTRDGIDAVFTFSAPLGDDYSGAWTQSGPYANSVLRITVIAAAAGGGSAGVAVGVLRVCVLQSGNLTSLDGTTAPSTACTLVAYGTWGDVPAVSLACASHVAARFVVDWTRIAFVVGVSVECAEDDTYGSVIFSSSSSIDGGAPAVLTATGFAPLGTAACRAAVLLSFGSGRKDYDTMGEWAGAVAALALPTITAVTTSSGLMATSGGDTVTFWGENLGFSDSGGAVTAAYWPAAGGGEEPATGVYTMGACTHASAATLAPDGSVRSAVVVQCVSAEGAGSQFLWRITVDGGASAPVPSSVAYSPPVVVDVALQYNDTAAMDGAGGGGGGDDTDFARMVVRGRSFGPLGGAHVDRVWVSRAAAPEVAFTARGCAVTSAHVELTCELPIIAGALLVPTLEIAGQLSASPALSAPVPSISGIECVPSPCGALSTLPGDTIVLHGTGFGPRNGSALTPFNLLSGGYGSVVLRAPSGGAAVVHLAGCAVTMPSVRLECASPGGFGLGYTPVVTVFGQESVIPGRPLSVSFAAPHIARITTSGGGGGVLLVGTRTLISVTGAHFGGPAALLLNGLPAAGVPYALPNSAQTALVFNLPSLPSALLANATVWVGLSILGVPSDGGAGLPLPVAPPTLRAVFPITVLESPPPGGCTNGGAVRYWLEVAGANFGADPAVVSVVISAAVGGGGVCVLCNGTLSDASLVCATNVTAGALAVRVGAQSSASASSSSSPLGFSVTALLTFVRPSVTAVNDGASGAPISAASGGIVSFVLPTEGGLCEFLGDSFGEGGLIIVGGLVGGSRVYSADAVAWNTSRILIALSPGEGASVSVVIYQGGIQRPGAVLNLRFMTPVVTSVLPSRHGPTAGGSVLTIVGKNFGVSGPLVRFLGAGMRGADALCALSGPFNHTALHCVAPPGQGTALIISVTVGGQRVDAPGALAWSYDAPVVAIVAPAHGATQGGDAILVVGANFGLSPTVTLARGASEVVAFLPRGNTSGSQQPAAASNHTHLFLYAPAADGLGWHVIVAAGGQSSAGTRGPGFDYDPPVVLSASPWTSPTRGGGVTTFSGRNFGVSPAAVWVGGRPCTAESHTHTALTCVMPAGIGSNLTVLVVVAGQSNAVAPYRFSYEPAVIFAGRPNTPNAEGEAGLAFIGVNFGTEPTPVRILVGGEECPGAVWLNDNTVKCDLGRTRVGPKNVSITVANQVCARTFTSTRRRAGGVLAPRSC